MIVLGDILVGARTLFSAIYADVGETYKSQWEAFAMKWDTQGQSTVTNNWLGSPPMLRSMKDVVQFGKSFAHSYTVNVTEQGVAIEVTEQQFMNDPLDIIGRHIKKLALQGQKYVDKVAASALSDGFATTALGAGWDGAAFFADTHTFGSAANYDNKVATNLATDGVAYQAGWEVINLAQGDDGEPLGMVPSVLVVRSNSRLIARIMLTGQWVPNTAGTSPQSNVLVGDVDLVVSPFLTLPSGVTANQWYLLAGKEPLAPIVLYEQMPARFVPQDGLDSDAAFERNVYRYKVDNKLSVGLGDFRQAYGSTGT